MVLGGAKMSGFWAKVGGVASSWMEVLAEAIIPFLSSLPVHCADLGGHHI